MPRRSFRQETLVGKKVVSKSHVLSKDPDEYLKSDSVGTGHPHNNLLASIQGTCRKKHRTLPIYKFQPTRQQKLRHTRPRQRLLNYRSRSGSKGKTFAKNSLLGLCKGGTGTSVPNVDGTNEKLLDYFFDRSNAAKNGRVEVRLDQNGNFVGGSIRNGSLNGKINSGIGAKKLKPVDFEDETGRIGKDNMVRIRNCQSPIQLSDRDAKYIRILAKNRTNSTKSPKQTTGTDGAISTGRDRSPRLVTARDRLMTPKNVTGRDYSPGQLAEKDGKSTGRKEAKRKSTGRKEANGKRRSKGLASRSKSSASRSEASASRSKTSASRSKTSASRSKSSVSRINAYNGQSKSKSSQSKQSKSSISRSKDSASHSEVENQPKHEGSRFKLKEGQSKLKDGQSKLKQNQFKPKTSQSKPLASRSKSTVSRFKSSESETGCPAKIAGCAKPPRQCLKPFCEAKRRANKLMPVKCNCRTRQPSCEHRPRQYEVKNGSGLANLRRNGSDKSSPRRNGSASQKRSGNDLASQKRLISVADFKKEFKNVMGMSPGKYHSESTKHSNSTVESTSGSYRSAESTSAPYSNAESTCITVSTSRPYCNTRPAKPSKQPSSASKPVKWAENEVVQVKKKKGSSPMIYGVSPGKKRTKDDDGTGCGMNSMYRAKKAKMNTILDKKRTKSNKEGRKSRNEGRKSEKEGRKIRNNGRKSETKEEKSTKKGMKSGTEGTKGRTERNERRTERNKSRTKRKETTKEGRKSTKETKNSPKEAKIIVNEDKHPDTPTSPSYISLVNVDRDANLQQQKPSPAESRQSRPRTRRTISSAGFGSAQRRGGYAQGGVGGPQRGTFEAQREAYNRASAFRGLYGARLRSLSVNREPRSHSCIELGRRRASVCVLYRAEQPEYRTVVHTGMYGAWLRSLSNSRSQSKEFSRCQYMDPGYSGVACRNIFDETNSGASGNQGFGQDSDVERGRSEDSEVRKFGSEDSEAHGEGFRWKKQTSEGHGKESSYKSKNLASRTARKRADASVAHREKSRIHESSELCRQKSRSRGFSGAHRQKSISQGSPVNGREKAEGHRGKAVAHRGKSEFDYGKSESHRQKSELHRRKSEFDRQNSESYSQKSESKRAKSRSQGATKVYRQKFELHRQSPRSYGADRANFRSREAGSRSPSDLITRYRKKSQRLALKQQGRDPSNSEVDSESSSRHASESPSRKTFEAFSRKNSEFLARKASEFSSRCASRSSSRKASESLAKRDSKSSRKASETSLRCASAKEKASYKDSGAQKRRTKELPGYVNIAEAVASQKKGRGSGVDYDKVKDSESSYNNNMASGYKKNKDSGPAYNKVKPSDPAHKAKPSANNNPKPASPSQAKCSRTHRLVATADGVSLGGGQGRFKAKRILKISLRSDGRTYKFALPINIYSDNPNNQVEIITTELAVK
ncbi:unnamed protein product [Bursaphelenchus okinawaensis]|uniref:Uncharacterized protein n=1 Tax=Bursaphelenchus okinawaensis TaxID=465554 RepID=A0A811KR68_9BILA|nr:unnamed protein product [Bursaphelenchus okinawaensis]CAG9109783.1 unnamed protein product [Bursaphelenchus okinawaensis]